MCVAFKLLLMRLCDKHLSLQFLTLPHCADDFFCHRKKSSLNLASTDKLYCLAGFPPPSYSNISNLMWLKTWWFHWCVGRSQGICFPLVPLASRQYCLLDFKVYVDFLYSSIVKRLLSPFSAQEPVAQKN